MNSLERLQNSKTSEIWQVPDFAYNVTLVDATRRVQEA